MEVTEGHYASEFASSGNYWIEHVFSQFHVIVETMQNLLGRVSHWHGWYRASIAF